jgi:aerobic-type carbon monoxide dehydrogenase small subunit (CoxS/CutS family)
VLIAGAISCLLDEKAPKPQQTRRRGVTSAASRDSTLDPACYHPRMAITVSVNERRVTIDAAPDTPLLYVLANDLALNGPRFGCGLAQCGSCSVLVDGVETRSCVTPIARVADKRITTLEGLPFYYAKLARLERAPALHPLQQAVIDEQAAQCGYCYNGMIVKGAELLSKNPRPSETQIRTAMNGHLCRCGTYPRMLAAIQRAAAAMAEARR